jgi:hypothetical protein
MGLITAQWLWAMVMVQGNGSGYGYGTCYQSQWRGLITAQWIWAMVMILVMDMVHVINLNGGD